LTAILDNRVPPPLVCLVCGAGMSFTSGAGGESTLAFASHYGIGLSWLCLSLILIVLSIRQFKQHQTTVNPLRPSQASQLVSSGIFSVTRNPMYLSLTTILIGLMFFLGNWLGLLWLAVFMLYIQCFQIYPEERAMHLLFGDAYRDYCSRVRRWI